MKTDAEWVAEYRASRSDRAFAEIVARHRAMVFRTCLRVTGRAPDAEDSTQATFLIFARCPSALKGSLGGWLHGIATRAAWHQVQARLRRKKHEAVATIGKTEEVRENRMDTEGLRKELDRALERLPGRQREAVVLRYLEGLSQEEAAGVAGCPKGTLSRRAVEGLERLRRILASRGVSATTGILAAYVAQEAAGAAASAAGVSLIATKNAASGTTPEAVEALVNGGLKAMTWMKIKMAATVLAAVSVAGSGGGLLAYRTGPEQETKKSAAAVATNSPAAGGEIDAKNFEEMLKLVKPSPEESSWSDIPWMVDQDKARRKAAAEGKPLVAWTMSGEPMGVS